MTPLAIAFMVVSWSFVLGLTAWCFARILRTKEPKRSGGRRGRSGGKVR